MTQSIYINKHVIVYVQRERGVNAAIAIRFCPKNRSNIVLNGRNPNRRIITESESLMEQSSYPFLGVMRMIIDKAETVELNENQRKFFVVFDVL